MRVIVFACVTMLCSVAHGGGLPDNDAEFSRRHQVCVDQMAGRIDRCNGRYRIYSTAWEACRALCEEKYNTCKRRR